MITFSQNIVKRNRHRVIVFMWVFFLTTVYGPVADGIQFGHSGIECFACISFTRRSPTKTARASV